MKKALLYWGLVLLCLVILIPYMFVSLVFFNLPLVVVEVVLGVIIIAILIWRMVAVRKKKITMKVVVISIIKLLLLAFSLLLVSSGLRASEMVHENFGFLWTVGILIIFVLLIEIIDIIFSRRIKRIHSLDLVPISMVLIILWFNSVVFMYWLSPHSILNVKTECSFVYLEQNYRIRSRDQKGLLPTMINYTLQKQDNGSWNNMIDFKGYLFADNAERPCQNIIIDGETLKIRYKFEGFSEVYSEDGESFEIRE